MLLVCFEVQDSSKIIPLFTLQAVLLSFHSNSSPSLSLNSTPLPVSLTFFFLSFPPLHADIPPVGILSFPTEINTDFPEDQLPILTQWMRTMEEEVEAVRSVLLPFEVHVQLAKALTKKQPVDYSWADIDGKGVTVYATPPN